MIHMSEELIQVGTINRLKEEEVINLIMNSPNNIISIRSINEQTGVCYDYIKKIVKGIGYKIEKKPFPSHIRLLCVIKGGDNNENRK